MEYHRLLKRVAPILESMASFEQNVFIERIEQYIEDIIGPLSLLYGKRNDFNTVLGKCIEIIAKSYCERSIELRILDLKRLGESDWYKSQKMVGYVCYVDRFAGTLKGVEEKVSYLKELGITYLHLMPLMQPRPGLNDGGYAVSSYYDVNSKLGTTENLKALATKLRQNGISLCIDLVCNHTAKEHVWAQKALGGEKKYQDYYIMFSNRILPDQYEKTTPEVFPDWSPGNFSYYKEIKKWVWTTFNEYQWDLNYENPQVFMEILKVILFWANQGVEILRLDAVAFMWKELETNSQNQPKTHAILQAFRALTRVVAPGLVFKAEAIVSPKDLIHYLGQKKSTNKECELAYHNVFMVLLWSSLATRKVDLMTSVLNKMPTVLSNSTWCTYVRCHDDIGWAITEEDAKGVGLDGFMHRSFLSDFYSNNFPNTFALGEVFQHNKKTGDRRISGTCASLAGLEKALKNKDTKEIEQAIKRILLLHSMIFAFGGIPLIYMGDEIGLLNDRSYLEQKHLKDDNRWMHRPYMDWDLVEKRESMYEVQSHIFQGIRKLIKARKETIGLHGQSHCTCVNTHNIHIFGFVRESSRGRLLILANVTEQRQFITRERLRELGFSGVLFNYLNNKGYRGDIVLESYETMWLEKDI